MLGTNNDINVTGLMYLKRQSIMLCKNRTLQHKTMIYWNHQHNAYAIHRTEPVKPSQFAANSDISSRYRIFTVNQSGGNRVGGRFPQTPRSQEVETTQGSSSRKCLFSRTSQVEYIPSSEREADQSFCWCKRMSLLIIELVQHQIWWRRYTEQTCGYILVTSWLCDNNNTGCM